MRLDVHTREVVAVARGVQTLSGTIHENLTDADTTRPIEAEWDRQLAANAKARPETLLLVNTADVAISGQGVKLQSANRGRALSGGLTPARGYAPLEHGSRRKQFRPRNPRGYVVGPAIRAMIPRITDLWVGAAEDLLATALQGN